MSTTLLTTHHPPLKPQTPITSVSRNPSSSCSFSLRHNIKHLVCIPPPRCSLTSRHSLNHSLTHPDLSLLSFPLRHSTKHLVCIPSPRCSLDSRDPFEQPGTYPRPSEVKWKKELCNYVQLIGIVGLPVQLTHLSSGKVVGSTRIAVRKSATDSSWINLTFWEELAHTAHQHVGKGDQIFVSGRLLSDTVESEDGRQQTYYKVVVQQLNFVERSSPSPVSMYEDSNTSMTSAPKVNNAAPPSRLSPQELWQAFFANPTEWWDNRNNKKNPKAPDFKHKDTGEALWVEGRYNPPWVKSQLELLDSKMESLQRRDDTSLFDFSNGGL